MNLDTRIELLRKLVKETADYASGAQSSLTRADIKYKKDNERSPVSKIDLEVNKRFENAILSAFPDDTFISEEARPIKNSGTVTWIVDPIDGTSNYVKNTPEYSVTAAIIYDGKIMHGITFAPDLNEWYEAGRGEGVKLNGEKLNNSAPREIVSCFIKKPNAEQKAKIKEVLGNGIEFKYIGSAALELARLAIGKCDVGIYKDINIWDIAAGVLMIEELGGKITDFEGNPFTLETRDIFVWSPGITPKI